jgi:hypothetical protein
MKSPKYFILGLKLGLVDGDQVQNWVNEQIETTDSPTGTILDLAYLDRSNVKEIHSKLLSIPDDRDEFDALRDLLSIVTDPQLEDLEFCKRLARDLYGICAQNNYECPDDLKEIMFLDDAFCLAIQNTHGTLDEAHKSLVKFVKSFRKNC